jgi:hypothetical protein
LDALKDQRTAFNELILQAVGTMNFSRCRSRRLSASGNFHCLQCWMSINEERLHHEYSFWCEQRCIVEDEADRVHCPEVGEPTLPFSVIL